MSISINGNNIGTQTGSGQTPMTGTFIVPVSALIEGTNTLQMTSAVAGDYTLFDRITVSYSRKFVADQIVWISLRTTTNLPCSLDLQPQIFGHLILRKMELRFRSQIFRSSPMDRHLTQSLLPPVAVQCMRLHQMEFGRPRLCGG